MDTVGNMLVSINNAQAVGKARVVVPYAKFQHRLAEFMQKQGLLAQVKKDETAGKPTLKITLQYDSDTKRPIISKIKRISKPGRRYYARAKDVPYSLDGRGTIVVSTSQGLMNDKEARKQKLGGELICEIW